jgi:hypothetical protein
MINEYGALWNDNWQEKTEVSEKEVFWCHFVHHVSHMDYPGMQAEPQQWEAGSCLSALAMTWPTAMYIHKRSFYFGYNKWY